MADEARRVLEPHVYGSQTWIVTEDQNFFGFFFCVNSISASISIINGALSAKFSVVKKRAKFEFRNSNIYADQPTIVVIVFFFFFLILR